MTENKISYKALIPYMLSFILSFASYLIYTFVPTSDLANGLDHSGMDAVYVLTASPILYILSLILIVVTYYINRSHFDTMISKKITIPVFIVISLFAAISSVFAISFVATQYSLGFVAPFSGTKYEGFSIFMIVGCTLHLISFVLYILKSKGIIKK